MKRLAASFEIMGRDRGFSRADRRAVVMAGVREYRDRIRRAAGLGSLDAWYEHFEAGMLLRLVRQEVRVKRMGKSEGQAVKEMVAKARTRDGADVDTLLVPGATLYARICAATLARAHARWGDRIAVASYLGKGDAFDRAMADFAAAYADQNERDYAGFAAAVDAGRLVARTGV